MATKQRMITGVFRNRANAQVVYEDLISRGYTPKEINVLMSDATRASYASAEKREKIEESSHAVEGLATGGAVGTAVGATIAALAAIGTSIAFPGLGVMIAGPIIAGLAGGGAGAVGGGVIGWLIGLGIPESNAKAYEQALRDGGVVMGVVPRNKEEATDLSRLFREHEGENVCQC